MKKIIFLLPLLLGIISCGAQSEPTPRVSDVTGASLTAMPQQNSATGVPGTEPTSANAATSVLPALITAIPNPTLPAPAQTVTGCVARWFFTFDDKHLALGSFCPQPAIPLAAVGQDFEGGRVLRYAADPSYAADQRGTIYVIYNDGEWVTFPDGWDASQPIDDPSLVVPEGRYQPIKSIGKIWRENAEVRNRLGWAYEPEKEFLGRMQLYSTQPGQPQGDSHYFFIDHGKWGLVLLLNSVDMGPNKWEVAGTYQ